MTTSTTSETVTTGTSAATVTPNRRLDLDGVAPAFIRAVTALDEVADAEADRAGIDRGLRDLLKLRASQLNGCSYCVDLHSRDAIAGGEHAQRVFAVAVWPESNFFTARERAAFALTESVTRLSETHVPEAVWNEASAHFTDDETAALLAVIVAINAWNELAVATRGWRPRLQA
ncbi:alkylhydroperoxidase AhpD family core domain-containing protein [Agromyces sp. CF514]|uniref:carboxymuconolactone decarboxylase family protein n=1 Tax=Agromyces sp. CF514 TaxID=1881031 RepID=UPI0008EE69E2|nr:carboxymuconolactone decarboxylase family protein [Agromyces sp. CF514]SFR92082.1 alkylhydroperoxidase AhpD family core domain-containing protein [Agromyces sp. CF514]